MNERDAVHSFEAYNARWLTASQVASTFVPPTQFFDLAKHRHTILVGPRGSGKTTLLKMLQPAALERWIGSDAEYYRKNIDYTGVFIPADISWRQQLDSANSRVQDEGQRIILSNAAFATHILQALVEAMYFRLSQPKEEAESVLFKRCSIDNSKEALIVSEISRAFHAKPLIPTILSLKHSISARLAEINFIAKITAFSKAGYSKDNFSDYPFLFIDPLSTAGMAVAVFDDVCGEQNAKWALLFDELEIAPEAIQNELINSTRSTNSKFLFKLALSPVTTCSRSAPTSASPSPGNDFDQIQLWYAHKEQKGASRRKNIFCLSLWRSMVQNHGFPTCTPESVFGFGAFDHDNDWKALAVPHVKKRPNPYSASGIWGERFVNLYQTDPTFKKYLDQKSIAPDRLEDLSTSVKDSVIRKAAPIVAVREYYRRPTISSDHAVGGRSRKSIQIYTGHDALFDISEGHPRWFKVMMGRLLDQAKASSNTLRVSNSIQAQELLAASQRFAALLKTFPIEESDASVGNRGLLSLIDTIGVFFHSQVVKAPFTPEPYLSFIVDSHVADGLHRSLAQALNLGAIVYVPDGDGEVLLSSLRGKRFRISYWLAPHYGLPLILGKPVSLSRILSDKRKLVSSHNSLATMELPFDGEELI